MAADTPSLAEIVAALAPGQRLLGLDLGTKTIGLALSDVRFTIASPLETIRRTKFSVDAQALLKVIERQEVGALVIGLPLNMDGSAGPRVQATRAFVRNLAPLTPLPVAYWDERLSTAAVTRTLLDADASRARRGDLVDKLAAAYILQGALDRMRDDARRARQAEEDAAIFGAPPAPAPTE
ncbi:Holliday junction resolvase RuvX [Segnochrobactraceae bacterium EtOH-i3]